jgi:Biotin-lipoyl like
LLRRHPIAFAIGLVLLLAALPIGYLYWDYTTHFETTDDSYIAARQFAIAPEVSGYITAVPVTDNEHVNSGAVIARIDDRTYRAALAFEKMRKHATIASLIGAGLILTTTAFADPYNPADRAIGGGLLGAGTGAVIGAIAGGGHGAGIGAAVGGGVGAVMGAATTPPRPYHRYYHHHVVRSY